MLNRFFLNSLQSSLCLFLGMFALAIIFFPSITIAEEESTHPPKVASTLSEKGERSLKKAEQLMDNDSYDFAVDELRRALAVENHSDLHWFLGRAYSAAGERKLAYYSYSRSFKMDTSNIDVLAALADLVLEYGSVSEAEALVSHIEGLLPELVDTYKPQVVLKKADSAFKEGKYIRAFRYFEEVYSSVPILSQRAEEGCVKSLDSLALAYGKSRRPEKELKVRLKLYQIRPSIDLALTIENLWKKNGSPQIQKREVHSIIEHSRSLKAQ